MRFVAFDRASRKQVPIGRDTEVAIVHRVISDPANGAFVVVSGEAGIGKSTLVNHIVADRVAAGVPVLRGSATEHDAARFSLWRRVLRDLGIALPHFDASVGASDQIEELAAVTGDALIDGGWGLIVLEDLHWADEASLIALQLIRERLVGHAVAVLATARTGEPRQSALARLIGQAEPIVLRGVSAADIAAIAVRHHGRALGSDEADGLRRTTGGNPLLVRELLTGNTDRLSLAAENLLTRSIEALGDHDAAVLSVFAIAGTVAPLAALAYAVEGGEERTEAALERAVRADVLTSSPDGRWFRHDLLASAAAGRLAPAERREIHRLLAEFWAAAPSGDDDGLEQARHWLAAFPAVSAGDAASAVMGIAERLRRRRRAGDAADLLTRAIDSLAGASTEVLSRLWMALGEARWDLAEKPAALECFDRAATAADDLDLVTVAAIEVARQRYHNPFVPDPDARDRLAFLDAELGPGDSPLRAALLGRRAMLALQPPARHRQASELADEAVAVARRLADPEVLLVALCDRAFVVGDVDDLRRRGRLAEEVLDLARAAGRPDLAVAGYEWRCDDRLLTGDLASARLALDEFEALAAVAASPAWRLSARYRRAAHALAQGDHAGALETIESTVQLGRGLVEPFEQLGLEMSIRAPAMILFGLHDPRVADLQAQFRPTFDGIPSLFMQIRLALVDLLVGDHGAAQRRGARWLSKPNAAFEAPDALATLGLMAILVDELQRTDLAPAIAEALAPFEGLICPELPVPVDLLCGQLHLLAGDQAATVPLANQALALARAMPSPVAEAHCLRFLAEAQQAAADTRAAAAATAAAEAIADREGFMLNPPWSRRATNSPPGRATRSAGAPAVVRAAKLTRNGDVWTIETAAERGSIANMIGLSQIARLLQVPGLDIPASDLTGTSEASMSDLGPALDARAKRQYRQRITELQADIDEAEAWADPERAETLRRELDALITELRRAVGLTGRDRPQGSSTERARINAARNIRRAINAIHLVAPQLAAHLAVSIRTGHQCSYTPEPAARFEWDIDLGQ